MTVEQLYTQCLAQGAYYITSGGEAAIIDPLRDVAPYLERLSRDNVVLKYIFETHFHADFVSGHLDLSKQTGATIVYGPTAAPAFPAHIATDNAIFSIGDVRIQLLHTPGHTMESSCFLLLDESGKECAIFTGDTLFLGDVGRPDLAQKAAKKSKEELAGLLYTSIYQKLLPLPDDVIVYPGHGAGSACGKNMMRETSDTLGHQKMTNYALRQPDMPAFVHAVLDELQSPPGYFGYNASLNKMGSKPVSEVLYSGTQAIPVALFEKMTLVNGMTILDTRSGAEFANGFVPGSINIGLSGAFAPWVGAMLIDVQKPIILISTPGTETETVTRLGRIGFDHVLGVLEGGFKAWCNAGLPIGKLTRISPSRLTDIGNLDHTILDVRTTQEYQKGHVAGSVNKPLNLLHTWLPQLDKSRSYIVYCAGGYRSMIAVSVMCAAGFQHILEISGGYDAITACPDICRTASTITPATV